MILESKAVKRKWLRGPLLVRLLGQAGVLCVMLNPVVVLGPHLLLSSLAGAPSSSRHFLFLAPRHPTLVVTSQSFLLLPPHVPRSQHWPGPGLNPEAGARPVLCGVVGLVLDL